MPEGHGSVAEVFAEVFAEVEVRGEQDAVELVRRRVRLKLSGPHAGWRAGTAHILDEYDPRGRRRILSQASVAGRLCISTLRALHASPLTIRADLDQGL